MSNHPYLEIARKSIQSHFDGSLIDKKATLLQYPEMNIPKATFVTLTLHGHLRGCIGSLVAHREFVDDLISNARSAAFEDPRFPPLSFEELNAVKIEVSLLSEPVLVDYINADDLKSKINPSADGVIIRYRNHQATFLPQVWEELRDFESFFAHLGMKAGIGSDPLAFHPEVYTYQVDKIKED